MSEQISQHMRISSSFKTAVSFTVSSRTKTPSKIVEYLQHTFRIIVASYAIFATIVKFQLTYYSELDLSVRLLLEWSLLDKFMHAIVGRVEWWMLSVTTLITLYLCIRRNYTGQ